MIFQPHDYIKRYVNVEILARDGTILRADVYMPAGQGPFPVVMMRSPYLKSPAVTPHYSQWGKYYAARGLAFLMCDVRGRGDSDGVFRPFFNEVQDGFDSVEWAAAQPWCNGQVGMDGNSYNAHTAWMAVLSGAPHLKAITVSGVPGDLQRHGTYGLNGIQSLYIALWMFMTRGHTLQIPIDVYGLKKPYEFLPDLALRALQTPAAAIPDLLGFDGRDWLDLLAHPAGDSFWNELSLDERLAGSQVAGLHVTGWFDNCLPGTIAGFDLLRQTGACPASQYLLVGPWTHDGNAAPSAVVGDLSFNPAAAIDMLELKTCFFKHYLAGEGQLAMPKVQLYDMGRQVWQSGDDYVQATEKIYYLSARRLASSPGETSQLVYDPRSPTPAPAYLSPVDNAFLTQRPDVAHFTGETLVQPITIAGESELHLSLRANSTPIDLIATLCDQFPDGRSLPLAFGGMKMASSTPGTVHLKLPRVQHTFQAGHCIALLVQCAAIPLYVPPSEPLHLTIDGTSSIRWRSA